ncbi:MAG: hypothetical protein ABI910_11655 [Gemmatimonadota bacterium]
MARPRAASSAIGIFVGVPLAPPIFLLTIGRDALHARNTRLASTSATPSLVLAAGSGPFHRYLR